MTSETPPRPSSPTDRISPRASRSSLSSQDPETEEKPNSPTSSLSSRSKHPSTLEAADIVPTLASALPNAPLAVSSSAAAFDDDLKEGFVGIKDEEDATTATRVRHEKLTGNERQVDAPGLTDWLLRRNKWVGDLDAVATQPSVFDDPDKAKFYQPHPKWENLHRFQPSFRWTWREERAVIRKTDLYIASWSILMFFSLDLDRSNIGQALSDNLLHDLRIDTDDYNLGQTLFRVAFLLAELPSQMVSKKIGSDRWVPIQLCVWSVFSAAQFWMKGRGTFLFFRFMIGALQGGFIADQVLYLSYFYKKTELPMRLALFWVSNALVDFIGPCLAVGILHLRGVGGRAGWRYLFLIEGVFTLAVGLASFVMMPSSPTATRTWFWRTGWFTEHQERIIVNRVIRDDPGKASMWNRQGLTLAGLWASCRDYDLWPIYLLALTFWLPSTPIGSYLTLNLRELGFGTFETNLLTMPSAALAMVTLIAITLLSERFNTRSWMGLVQAVWTLVGMVALYSLPAAASRWSYWGVVTYILGSPVVHAIQVAWISRQAGTVRTRTVASALYNMFVQAQAIIGANIYRDSDRPRYRTGNLVLLIVSVYNVALYVAVYFYYKKRNESRDRRWDAMTRDQQIRYLATTKDVGNRRLDFRFAY